MELQQKPSFVLKVCALREVFNHLNCNFICDEDIMSAPNLRSAAAAAMGAALMLTPMALASKANAQEAIQVSNQTSLTTVYDTSVGAVSNAGKFSDQRNSVSVVVFFGPDADPYKVGDLFAQELRNRGVNGQSFAAPKNTSGYAVAYTVGATEIGPLSVQDAAAKMSDAVQISQTRDRILSPDYVVPAASPR
jgi:hypothetical protein